MCGNKRKEAAETDNGLPDIRGPMRGFLGRAADY
jgi:hypothetical protein